MQGALRAEQGLGLEPAMGQMDQFDRAGLPQKSGAAMPASIAPVSTTSRSAMERVSEIRASFSAV